MFHRPSKRPRGWRLVLAWLLAVGEPLLLAVDVSRLLPTLGTRGPAVALFLLVRLAAAGFGVAAGLALLARRPHAVGMARLALAALAAVSLVSVLTPILPSSRLPGTAGPTAVAVAAYYGAWLAYLSRARGDD